MSKFGSDYTSDQWFSFFEGMVMGQKATATYITRKLGEEVLNINPDIKEYLNNVQQMTVPQAIDLYKDTLIGR